jgi:hypothetical protein
MVLRTLPSVYHTTRRHIPEDSNLHNTFRSGNRSTVLRTLLHECLKLQGDFLKREPNVWNVNNAMYQEAGSSFKKITL